VSCPEFAPDFYNNVAAVAVVLMFTKVVSHGLRKVRRKPTATRCLTSLHYGVVGGATLAVLASLIATFARAHVGYIDILAWAGLFIAAASLIIDIVIEQRSDDESSG